MHLATDGRDAVRRRRPHLDGVGTDHSLRRRPYPTCQSRVTPPATIALTGTCCATGCQASKHLSNEPLGSIRAQRPIIDVSPDSASLQDTHDVVHLPAAEISNPEKAGLTATGIQRHQISERVDLRAFQSMNSAPRQSRSEERR